MNSMMRQSMLAAVLLGVGCTAAYAQPANTEVSPFIVGGKPADKLPPAENIHWQVALVEGDDGTRRQFCGGTLVAPNWVMTAAHCVDSVRIALDPKRLDVIAGTLSYGSGGVRSNVEKIVVHPQWRKTAKRYDYDAALLKLETAVTAVAPLKLAAPAAPLKDGPTVRVSGWGAISEGGPGSPDLLYVDVPVVKNDECNMKESYDGSVTAQMFCAGVRPGGLDSCQGDSGGPVMSTISGSKELVGVVSWGDGCARRLKYGVYTLVSSVSQWAADTMAGN